MAEHPCKRWFLVVGGDPLPLTHLEVSILRASLDLARRDIEALRREVASRSHTPDRAPGCSDLARVSGALRHYLLTGERATGDPKQIEDWRAAQRLEAVKAARAPSPPSAADDEPGTSEWEAEAARRLAAREQEQLPQPPEAGWAKDQIG